MQTNANLGLYQASVALWSHQEESFHNHVLVTHTLMCRHGGLGESAEEHSRGQSELHASEMNTNTNYKGQHRFIIEIQSR